MIVNKTNSDISIRDGYRWFVLFDLRFLKKHKNLRKLLLLYYKPNFIDKLYNGIIYTILGVQIFGKLLPTGGAYFRKKTGIIINTHTLTSPTLKAAKDFRYRLCVWETMHIFIFLIVVIWLIFSFSNIGILKTIITMSVNILVNLYPALFHRYTRLRIEHLIDKKSRKSG